MYQVVFSNISAFISKNAAEVGHFSQFRGLAWAHLVLNIKTVVTMATVYLTDL